MPAAKDWSDYASEASTPAPSSSSASAARVTSVPTSGGDNSSAFGLSDKQMGLSVLFGRGGQVLAGGEARNNNPDEVPHAFRIGTAPDDIMSMLDAVKFFYGINPAARAVIQGALVNKGFITRRGWNNFQEPDEISGRAWETALMRAVKTDKTIWEVLGGKSADDFFSQADKTLNAAFKSIGGSRGGGGSRRAPLQIRYTNPEDLKAAARATAQDTIGYVPDDGFLDDFVKLYHGMEAGAQRKAYNGGNYTDPGNPQVRAAKELKDQHKTEAEGFAIVKQFENLLGVLGVNQ